MNSQEAGRLIADLYSSLNVDHPANPAEGLEFMNANDTNRDNQISLRDFEDIFVKYLSTGGGSGYRLFLDPNTYATGNVGGVHHAPQVVTTGPRVVSHGAPVGRVVSHGAPVHHGVPAQGRVVGQPIRRV